LIAVLAATYLDLKGLFEKDSFLLTSEASEPVSLSALLEKSVIPTLSSL
jgi:hypothetical protein